MLRIFIEGAYGRTYDNADKVITDWCSNLDFKIIDGPYLNASEGSTVPQYNFEIPIILSPHN